MSLYYASLQKLDKPDIVLEIRIMDTANIKEIPASATFFAGTIAVLILKLKAGEDYLLELPEDITVYEEKVKTHPSLPIWEKFASLYFGETLNITEQEYNDVKTTFKHSGKEVMNLESGSEDDVKFWQLTYMPVLAEAKEFVQQIIKGITEVKSHAKKQKSYIITLHDKVFPDFLKAGIQWESHAAR